jgi:hypothetical protein
LNTALCNNFFSTGGHTSTNFTRWKCIRATFFLALEFFKKSDRAFSIRQNLATAASVVQHPILMVRLLADSPLSVACNMRACVRGIAIEQLGFQT